MFNFQVVMSVVLKDSKATGQRTVNVQAENARDAMKMAKNRVETSYDVKKASTLSYIKRK